MEVARWQQRLDSFGKAMTLLESACSLLSLSELERAGLVQFFQFSFELCWKTLKDILFVEGFEVKTPREVFRKGFELGLLQEDETEILLDGLLKRNLLTHTYEVQIAETAEHLVKTVYLPVMRGLLARLKQRQP